MSLVSFRSKAKTARSVGLRSSSVKLEEYLGHKVSITGSASEESKAEEQGEQRRRGREGFEEGRSTGIFAAPA
jgi:hypothetical protein